MENTDLSRRALLEAFATVMVAAATPIGWTEVADAIDQAHAAAASATPPNIWFRTAAEGGDSEAVAAKIVPTADPPGANEAGVVYFIDRALGTFFSQLAGDYRPQPAEFRAGCRRRHPATSFASLTSEQQ